MAAAPRLMTPYLTDDCQMVVNSGRRRLRSADVDTCITCIVPRTNNWLSDRSFTVAGPRFWNTNTFVSGTPSAGHWTCYISAAAKNL